MSLGRQTRDGVAVRRVQVMLDDATIERARVLGDGNLSQGIRQAVASLPPAPGAQPAPSIPEGWKPIPEKHPTFDLVDLKLADGSVLCECVPQSDGDYWWNGPSGEVFIDPKYAPATHWRLAAAPEGKP